MMPSILCGTPDPLEVQARVHDAAQTKKTHLPSWESGSERLKRGGAAGNRTLDLFDANEARYQLRYSPGRGSLREPPKEYQSPGRLRDTSGTGAGACGGRPGTGRQAGRKDSPTSTGTLGETFCSAAIVTSLP